MMTSALRTLFALVSSIGATSSALAFPNPARVSPPCVARVNTAALQAMERTNPLGQIMVVGDPIVFDPHVLRVEVRVFGARTILYNVDLTIDDACHVLSATTQLESNPWYGW
jgi:hypothetical protein